MATADCRVLQYAACCAGWWPCRHITQPHLCPLITRVFLSPILNTITIPAQYTAAVSPGRCYYFLLRSCSGPDPEYEIQITLSLRNPDSRLPRSPAGRCAGTPVSLIGPRRGRGPGRGQTGAGGWWVDTGHLVIGPINKQTAGMEIRKHGG